MLNRNGLGFLTLAFLTLPLQAADNICSTHSRASGNIRGACGDRTLPANKTRNLHRNSVRLECSSEVDHFMRSPEPFSFKDSTQKATIDEWLWLEEEGDRVKMQNWRHAHSKIPMWKGTIPYDTIEKWTWEDCVLGYDLSCPEHTRYVQKPVYNDKGKQTGTKTVAEKYRPACYHDENQSESRHCSSEQMLFDSEFIRPSVDKNTVAVDSEGNQFPGYTWNPSSPDYYDVIPSKYDLLPGEVEDVQIYSNASLSTTIAPTVKIGDAWNTYNFRISLVGHGASTSCEMRRYYNKPDLHLKVRVLTEKRMLGKKTPNAFRAYGLDSEGNHTPPLNFNLETNSKGKEIRTNPYQLSLVDTSSFVVEAMARQSRKSSADRELEKAANGEGSSTTKAEKKELAEQSEKRGFYKDTRIRVKLIEVKGMLVRDIRLDKLYTNSADATRGSFYLIPLEEGADSLYKIMGFEHHLKPSQNYKISVAMYNHGVPFYKKEGTGIDALEGWYSDELPMPFTTHTEMKDKRGFVERYVIDHANATTSEKWKDIWSLITFEWLRN
ncbi:MAG: hypothetical protein KA116_08795 [Proteobacteria bacterium]|nr:hypothetical protein [Pseudomonadota bacterium]